MSLNKFLNEVDSYKYYIVKILETKSNVFFSENHLIELLGLSKYKFEKLIKDIEEDGKILKIPISVKIETSGEIVANGIDNLAVKKLRLYYLENSRQYKILKELLMGKNINSDNLPNKLFLSRSSFYNELRELKKNLKEYQISITNLKLSGEELTIRVFLFSLFNEFYNGIALPFQEYIMKKANKFKQMLLLRENIYLTKIQEYQLDLFLGIVFMRIAKDKYMSISVSDTEIDMEKLSSYLNIFNNKKKNREQIIEITNIFFFCYTEGLLESIGRKNFHLFVDNEVNGITQKFLATLKETFSCDLFDVKRVEKEITRINRKWLFFHFRSSTFTFENQKSYFQEVYPKLDQLIRNFLTSSEFESYFKSNEERTKIYYDYLFLLVTLLPIELMEDVIYICVDFSHGNFYNEFIKRSISSFKNLNVKFERKLTRRTHIYISDFVLNKITCPQIIWKNPPGPNDWKLFGDMVVALKEESYE